MKLLFRTVTSAARAMFRSNLPFEGVSRCRFCVAPTDLDINLHMNNGRFLQIMDIGRRDWMLRKTVGVKDSEPTAFTADQFGRLLQGLVPQRQG